MVYLTRKEQKDVTDDRSIGITKYNFLRNRAGLYGYVSHEDKWYIGEAKNLAERFIQHDTISTNWMINHMDSQCVE